MKILGKGVIDKDFPEIFTSEIISVTGGLLAGTLLLTLIQKIYLLPGLFILLPGFLETHGNIFGSLAARLSVLLHLKHIKPRVEHNRILYINVLASIFLLLIVAVVLGLLASTLNHFLFGEYSFALVFVALFAAVVAILLELPLTILTTFWLYKHHHDPDDIMGPYITTLGDIISTTALLVAMLIIV